MSPSVMHSTKAARMRLLALVGVAWGPSAVAAGPAAPRQLTRLMAVSLVVNIETGTHCDGSAPTAGEGRSRTRPASGQHFLVRRGEENVGEVLIDAVADASGTVTFSLPRGRFCVVEAMKRTPATSGENVDLNCLAAWSRSCDAIVTVPGKPGAKVAPQAVTIVHRCGGPCALNLPPPPPPRR